MTFDFAPDWLDTLSNAGDTTAIPFPRADTTAAAPLDAAPARAPRHPSRDQMAQLVGELFAEGSLSFEQLCSLSNAPEMQDLLDDTVAGATPWRRMASGRR